MTEHTPKYTRRTVSLPSGTGLDLLVRWVTEGPASLSADLPGTSERRTRTLRQLRRLATGLDVPEGERKELLPVHGRDFSSLSDVLLNSLAWRARARGYLMPGGTGRTPFTPVQADTLYRTVWGATPQDIAQDTGTRSTGVHGNLKRLRERHGCATTAQLVACAFRNRWFPDHEELHALLRGRMVWSRGIQTDRPPYKWTDGA